MSATLIALVVLIAVLIGLITFFIWSFQYWKNKKLPFEDPSIPFGSLKNVAMQMTSIGELLQKCYNKGKASGNKHVGLFAFWKPIYMPIDLKIIKAILTTDFNNFTDKKVYFNEKDDPLSANLFTIDGTKWRNLRAKLTSTFTSGKLKAMFPSFIVCAENLKKSMDVLSVAPVAFDAREILSCFTIDIIGSCAFGLECNSFKNPNSEFMKYGKMVFLPSLWQSIVAYFGFCSPELARSLRFRFINKSVAKFFTNITRQTIDYREKNNVKRHDFLQLLMDLKSESQDQNHHDSTKVMQGLTFDEIAAQLFLFFMAGYETSSTTMNFCLFELSANPDIQERARNEINTTLKAHNGKITYESIASLKYLDQVIDETLRKYPPIGIINRNALSDYPIPDTKDVLEKDTPVFISVFGLHRDPAYFPDPEKFDPERFSEENKSKIVPFTYLPFGEGPRNCIGMRFGRLQVKVGLTILLQHFFFSVNLKTITPLEFDPKSLILAAKNGIWLNVNKV